MTDASLQKRGFAFDESEESDVIVGVERRVDFDGHLNHVGASHFRSQILHDSQRVSVVEIEQHHVRTEFGLVGAKDALQRQIVVKLLETLQAFGQVLRVDFLVENVVVFLAESFRAKSVPTGAFLNLIG